MSKYAGEMMEGENVKWWVNLSAWKKVFVLLVAPVVLGGAVGLVQRAARGDVQEPLAVVSQECPCSDTGLCTGPRGGRYCVDDSGNKRYKPRQ